jgi:hypothetical protein
LVIRTKLFGLAATLLCGSAWAQQANVNLDFNPQKNTENLYPSADGKRSSLGAP